MEINLNKILVTGGRGTIGEYLDFGIKTGRSDFDITGLAASENFINRLKPEAILHLAAEPDVDKCEREPREAYFINSVGTYNLALIARNLGIKFIYISTSGVFDGEKSEPYKSDDQPNPINHYGHSKYFGEIAVSNFSRNNLIIRTDWVFGGGPEKDTKLVAKTIAQLNKPEMFGVSDQKGSPTYAKDLARVIKEFLVNDEEGIRHAVNSGPASQYEFMLEILNILGKKVKLNPVKAEDFKSVAKRWNNKVLKSDVAMRSWQEALREYLELDWGLRAE